MLRGIGTKAQRAGTVTGIAVDWSQLGERTRTAPGVRRKGAETRKGLRGYLSTPKPCNALYGP